MVGTIGKIPAPGNQNLILAFASTWQHWTEDKKLYNGLDQYFFN